MQHNTLIGNPAAVHIAALSLAVPFGVAQSGSTRGLGLLTRPVNLLECSLGLDEGVGAIAGPSGAASISRLVELFPRFVPGSFVSGGVGLRGGVLPLGLSQLLSGSCICVGLRLRSSGCLSFYRRSVGPVLVLHLSHFRLQLSARIRCGYLEREQVNALPGKYGRKTSDEHGHGCFEHVVHFSPSFGAQS